MKKDNTSTEFYQKDAEALCKKIFANKPDLISFGWHWYVGDKVIELSCRDTAREKKLCQ